MLTDQLHLLSRDYADNDRKDSGRLETIKRLFLSLSRGRLYLRPSKKKKKSTEWNVENLSFVSVSVCYVIVGRKHPRK